jgi:membrane dipeptidase
MTGKFLLGAAAILAAAAPVAAGAQAMDAKTRTRIDRILKATPLIDGHNDLPEALREHYGMSVDGLASGGAQRPGSPLMTDMARLHAGRVSGQF